MKHKVLIVEDEFTIAFDIEQRLTRLGYEIKGVAVNYDEAIPLLEHGGIDVILMDINLEDKKSGIDLAQLVAEKYHFPVVFLTAYTDDETFTKAAEANPMGYLNKPFKDSDLHHGLQLAIRRHQLQKSISQEDITQPEFDKLNDAIFVKDKGQLKRIEINDIVWVEAMDNYTIIHLENSKFVASTFLKDILNVLGNRFVRIHRSHAVALNKITSIEDNIVFIHDTYITISKSYKADLLRRLNLV